MTNGCPDSKTMKENSFKTTGNVNKLTNSNNSMLSSFMSAEIST